MEMYIGPADAFHEKCFVILQIDRIARPDRLCVRCSFLCG